VGVSGTGTGGFVRGALTTAFLPSVVPSPTAWDEPHAPVWAAPSMGSGVKARLRLVEALFLRLSMWLCGALRRDMRPTAHSLSFACPKESKQRKPKVSAKPKGDPESGGPGIPGLLCAARTRREVQKLALRAQTSELLDPSCPALLDASHGDPKSQRQRAARLAAPNIAVISTLSTKAMRSEPWCIGFWAPLRRAEQRSGRRKKKFRCLSPQGEFLNFPPPASSARQPRYSGASEPGSPFGFAETFGFLCLLSFGEAKESECAVGRTSRRGAMKNDPLDHHKQ